MDYRVTNNEAKSDDIQSENNGFCVHYFKTEKGRVCWHIVNKNPKNA